MGDEECSSNDVERADVCRVGALNSVPLGGEETVDPISEIQSEQDADGDLNPGGDDAEIGRLAGLSLTEYERQRMAAAKRLGLRVAMLDRLVGQARGPRIDEPNGQGDRLELNEPEPWPESVDGARLVQELTNAIHRHVAADGPTVVTVALWCVAVHAFSAFHIFPRLFLTAPTKGAGKTTLLDVIEQLVPRPLLASSATAAVLFRAIPIHRPVLLLDEADAWARNNEDVRMVLNAGHKRGGKVLRCVGDDHEPRAFDVFAPAVLAAIGRLSDTIEDRSIVAPLRRKLPAETVEPLRDGLDELQRLARRMARWASDNAPALAEARPEMPPGMTNRTADNWMPLLAVADLAGEDWANKGRLAAIGLTGEGMGGAESSLEMLLADIKDAYDTKEIDRLRSDEILVFLYGLEGRPWMDFDRGRPLDLSKMAGLLRPLGIRPRTVRFTNGTAKGYHRDDFQDAFARYVPQN